MVFLVAEEVSDEEEEDDDDDDLAAAFIAAEPNLRCSLGLEDGFQVGLWRPLEGDLVGEPAL